MRRIRVGQYLEFKGFDYIPPCNYTIGKKYKVLVKEKFKTIDGRKEQVVTVVNDSGKQAKINVTFFI